MEMMDQLILMRLMLYRKTSVDHIGHSDWKGFSFFLFFFQIPVQPAFILFSILTVLFSPAFVRSRRTHGRSIT